MGRERKRGKLEEFNLFLKNVDFNPFLKINNQIDIDRNLLSLVKYVITLDSDTIMPRDSAKNLIGTILHPLNSPKYNPELKKVTKGYCILQPRINITPTSSYKSFFSKTYSGNTGIDPYTMAISDSYQDLFGEGIFVGKGLYVVDTFIKCLEGKIQENTILSHDLYEGLFARTALVTDIEFYDDYPSHYEAYAKRLHRWIRGDWQISKSIFEISRNKFSLISRWKIFDNLRRTLVAPTLLIWFYFSFLISSRPYSSLSIILITLLLPGFIYNINSLIRYSSDISIINHIRNVFDDLKTRITQTTLSIIFLPHQSYMSLDAIIRTLYRINISKKNLLEWTTAAETEAKTLSKKALSLNIIIPTEIFVIITSISLILSNNIQTNYGAIPFLLLWFLFPQISQTISKIRFSKQYTLNEKEELSTRQLARRTWAFFETFVTQKDNWLVPDNYQEDPRPAIAHRTSPTNIGVLLLSTASAYDFGYISSIELLERLEETQKTLDKLNKYKGHFYNWYDTTSLEPLHPIYISTVDSGNLAAHLITMKIFCLHLLKEPIIKDQIISGINDTLMIVKKELNQINPRFLISPLFAKHHSKGELQQRLLSLIAINKDATPKTFSDWLVFAKEIKSLIENFSDTLNALMIEHGNSYFTETSKWTSHALRMIQSLNKQLISFSPWQDELIEQIHNEIIKNPLSFGPQINELMIELKSPFNINTSIESLDSFYLKKQIILIELKTIIQRIYHKTEIPNFLSFNILKIEESIANALEFNREYSKRCHHLAKQYDELSLGCDFSFLYNKERKIFSIGFNLTEGKMDNSYYDLLASEARLASLFAIAKGDVPLVHWFHLGRQMSSNKGHRALVSWSASMFEYLMPLLVMKNYPNTLLHQTYESVVNTQIGYANNLGIPWGISESAYNSRDLLQTYQYGPFGIPGMGLKYGLGLDVVISPYSTALAAMINPKASLENFKVLKKEKTYSDFGFYESIDYTTARLQKGHKFSIIKSYMAHHQGMILISLNNVLNDNIMQTRFHADPIIKSTELLLQEKVPTHMTTIPQHRQEGDLYVNVRESHTNSIRRFENINTVYPNTNILSNGVYTVMASTTGSGFSLCNNISVNRWTEDSTLDAKGCYIYLRDHLNNSVSSISYQPLNKNIESYECNFSEHKIEFTKRNPDLQIHTEIIVSPEDNVEIRRVTVTNNTDNSRNVDLTSYIEPVLAKMQDDNAHLAFSKLFLETEYIPSREAILVHRRKRSHNDKDRWGIHVVVSNGKEYSPTEYETERVRFIGRGRTVSNPLVIMENLTLSNTSGTVLDPILSLRKNININPRSKTKISFATGIAESREDALRLIDQYHDIHAFEREEELAWTKTQSQLRHLNIDQTEAVMFQELASTIIFSNPQMRPSSENLQKNKKSQDGLWADGLSGDIPILSIKVYTQRDIPLVKLILRAHEYLRFKKIFFDLVILNNEISSYRMSLHDEIIKQTHIIGGFDLLNKNGGIFLINTGLISEDENNLFLSFSKVVIDGHKGTLKDQLKRLKLKTPSEKIKSLDIPISQKHNHYVQPLALPKLQFYNGIGGFNLEGNEYVIFLNKGQHTPAPWVNVIANNNDFGFIISETGNGYTWASNSRENRLTPWSNDPVNDAAGEAFYLRDEDTQNIWSPTPWPIRNDRPYLIKHGLGYSQFQYNNYGINHELTIFTSLNENIKIGRLKIKNTGIEKRRLSATYFAEWTLGNSRTQTTQYLVTKKIEQQNILLAQNPFSNEYKNDIAFCALSGSNLTYTSDRKKFLGRNGSYQNPQGMKNKLLDQQCGAGLDPCAVLRTFIELNPQEEKEIIVLLGQSNDIEKINKLVNFHFDSKNISDVLNDINNFWDKTTSTIQIKTPAPEFDLMFNRWLLYQTLTCRMWARTALYQSGGAYGFRDQLQDSLGLIYSYPKLARDHIIKSASHQFPEGDVQHWWHPPSNKGVRTHFSDDLLWLPYVVSKYITKTQDWSILDELVHFVDAPLLLPEQEDIYVQPKNTTFSSSIYDHCVRAINHSLKVGIHNLPLIGAGDWNDGMNNIGLKGNGESVWVGWFLAKILKDFSPICLKYGHQELHDQYMKHSHLLTNAIEENAWDGKWYMRAFFDDGTPLGSSINDECKIDSLTQSWSVLTALGNKERQEIAMDSVFKNLVLKNDKLCVLFIPPFDKGVMNPGYIKGYPSGIRENGGQYNHATIWSSMAFALLGDSDKAFEILSFINPINRTSSISGIQLYKVEPYVLSADIYSGLTHAGRGGWSWYTGSSSLYYQAVLEYILGMHLEGDKISFDPCIPKDWEEFEINYQWKSSTYQIKVKNPMHLSKAKIAMELDGEIINEDKIILHDDGKSHLIFIKMEAFTA